MIGRLALVPDHRAAAAQVFSDSLGTFASDGPIVVPSHFDAGGLSAAAILVRSLRRARRVSGPLTVGGNGHATGPALQASDWNSFVLGLGIPQAQVPA